MNTRRAHCCLGTNMQPTFLSHDQTCSTVPTFVTRDKHAAHIFVSRSNMQHSAHICDSGQTCSPHFCLMNKHAAQCPHLCLGTNMQPTFLSRDKNNPQFCLESSDKQAAQCPHVCFGEKHAVHNFISEQTCSLHFVYREKNAHHSFVLAQTSGPNFCLITNPCMMQPTFFSLVSGQPCCPRFIVSTQ